MASRSILVVGILLKGLFALLAVGIPLMGVWVGSSIAAYQGGEVWIAAAVGLVFFPVLPLLWDGFASWRRSRRKEARPRILTMFDRLLLRTLALNTLFVGGLLGLYPQVAFTALSARGDWMLADVKAPWADKARAVLFAAADRLEWLHESTHVNPYEDLVDESARAEDIDDDEDIIGGLLGDLEALRDAAQKPDVEPGELYTDERWPFAPTLHPLVTDLPADAETSIIAVGQYIAEREPDPVQRVKALHDYVADRVAYDAPALVAGNYPAQDAESVFTQRVAVCAGYANLLAALGDAADVKIVVVGGDARGSDGELDGRGHAWNAAQIADRWYLLDATWNAGSVDGSTFTKSYGTTYFMSPPEVFGVTHLPDEQRWQLRESPLSRGDFLRQPHLSGDFYALGLRLESPDRSQVTVDDALTLTVDNPHDFDLHTQIVYTRSREHAGFCTEGAGDAITCQFANPGAYAVQMFGPQRNYLGAVYVNAG